MTQPQGNESGVIKVKLLRAGRIIRSYKVRSETFTIGTDAGSTIRAAGDPDVKPKHASIYIDEGELTLVPEPGAVVLLNDEPIDFAVPSPDDIIKIGKLTLKVELADSMESIPPAARHSSPPASKPTHAIPAPAPTTGSAAQRRAAGRSVKKTMPMTLNQLPKPSKAPPTPSKSAPRKPAAAPMAKVDPTTAPVPAPTTAPFESKPEVAAPVPTPTTMDPAPSPSVSSPVSRAPTPSAASPARRAADDSITMDLDMAFDELQLEDAPTRIASMPPEDLVALTTPSDAPAPRARDDVVFADVDPEYFFGEEDEESFVETFSLAERLLTEKRTPVEGPTEPYSVAHVIRVVDDRVVDAFGVVPNTPYKTIDGELKCHIVDAKDGPSRLLLETGATVSGELWIKGQKQLLDATPSFKTELTDGDFALLKGAGGTYKIEVYRPPLAPKKGQLFSISYPMMATVIVLAFILHGAAAYALRYIELDRIGDISAEEEEVFAEVILDKPDTPKPVDEQVIEEVEQDAKSIAERAPKVSQKAIRRRMKNAPKQKQQQVSSLLNVLSRGSGKAGESNKLKDLISNIDAVAPSNGASSGFSIAGAIASLPGNGVNVARSGGGGAISTLGGDQVAGKGTGIASLGSGKRKGKVRGKVTKMSSGARIGGTLSREDVMRVINKHIHAIQACYERALMGNPALSGRIAIDWTVATSGRVKSVRVRSSTIGSPKVANCISGVIKRWKFPQPKGGEANITFPFLFRSGS